MDMFGKVGLVEVPILIAPDQKAWMDRMIKEGKIAIPPGGTLEKGSLYSMFVRMLLHNAMEEQKRQEALEMDDEDDDEYRMLKKIPSIVLVARPLNVPPMG
jgi:hypothetical protein